jgi:replicative DNA helicase
MVEMDQIEAAVIGACLVVPQNIANAIDQGMRADWFKVDKWSLVWSVIESYWRRGAAEELGRANIVAEAKRIAAQEGEHRSADALTVTSITDAMDVAPVVIDDYVRLMRNDRVETAAKKAVADAFKLFPEYAHAADVVAIARRKMDEVIDTASAEKKIPARALLDDIAAEYREAYAKRVDPEGPRDLKWTPGIKMPWPKLTTFLNGLRPGLHVVAARPSVGKTSYAVNLMRYWCESGVGVMFCSLDMPRMEVMRRFVAERARVSARKAAFSPTKTDLEAMDDAAARIAAWPLEIVETHDVDDLRMAATAAVFAERVKVIVVDYLQLLHARSLKREDAVEYARISYVSDALKRLANELGIPVVALAQLNRESTKADQKGRMPGLAELRGSGSIEQDAFTVTILHRDAGVAEKWKSGNDELAMRLIPGTLENPSYRYNLTDLDPIWWVLCKAQNGPTGAVPFVVRKKYFAWMIGDYDAVPTKSTVGYGSTAHEVVDNAPYFRRVHADWRHDPLEATLKLQCALIDSGDDVTEDDNLL